ncbi:MAG: glutamate racemase [Bacilli bacterium]
MGKIGVFDSGIGGITVLEELYKLLPNEEYLYFGDNKNAPYGDKSNNEIRDYTYRIINHFKNNDVKLIVIACNTVTSFLYKELVDTLNIPVIGVIYPTVDYVNDLHIKKVGLIATVRTIENNTYQRMIDKEVFTLKTPQFVPMIEDGSYVYRHKEIKEILKPLLKKHIHALVLGCTHYPFLRSNIEKIYGGIIVDSSVVTAIEVKEVLNDRNMFENNPKITIHVSGNIEEFEKVIQSYISFEYKIKSVEV